MLRYAAVDWADEATAHRCASMAEAAEILATEGALAPQGRMHCLTTLAAALQLEVLFAAIDAYLQRASAQSAKRTTV